MKSGKLIRELVDKIAELAGDLRESQNEREALGLDLKEVTEEKIRATNAADRLADLQDKHEARIQDLVAQLDQQTEFRRTAEETLAGVLQARDEALDDVRLLRQENARVGRLERQLENSQELVKRQEGVIRGMTERLVEAGVLIREYAPRDAFPAWITGAEPIVPPWDRVGRAWNERIVPRDLAGAAPEAAGAPRPEVRQAEDGRLVVDAPGLAERLEELAPGRPDLACFAASAVMASSPALARLLKDKAEADRVTGLAADPLGGLSGPEDEDEEGEDDEDQDEEEDDGNGHSDEHDDDELRAEEPNTEEGEVINDLHEEDEAAEREAGC